MKSAGGVIVSGAVVSDASSPAPDMTQSPAWGPVVANEPTEKVVPAGKPLMTKECVPDPSTASRVMPVSVTKPSSAPWYAVETTALSIVAVYGPPAPSLELAIRERDEVARIGIGKVAAYRCDHVAGRIGNGESLVGAVVRDAGVVESAGADVGLTSPLL